MKKNLLIKKISLATLFLVLSFLIPNASAATVSIGSGSASENATTIVQVMANDVIDLAVFDLTITYNPKVVIVTKAENNPMLGMDLNNLENAANGSVRLGNFWITTKGLDGDVIISNLTLKAVGKAGDQSTLNVTINTLSNSTGKPIPATPVNGTFNILKNLPPSIRVLYPNGGEVIEIGTLVNVSASASDDLGVSKVFFQYSSNNGSSWSNIGFGSLVKGRNTSGIWNATWNTSGLMNGSNYLIKAFATDLEFTVNDTSDSTFELYLFEKGDIDGDGDVDLNDAIYLAKHVFGWKGYETIYANGDIDCDGDVDLNDAIYLAKHVFGWKGYEIIC